MISDRQRQRVSQYQAARETYLRARSEGFEEEARLESPTSMAGYNVHPLVVIFPLTVFLAVVVLDIVYLIGGDHVLAAVATWLLLPGVVGGLVAAIAGALDWWQIPPDTRAKSIGIWHGLGNLAALGLFFLSWVSRIGAPDNPGVLGVLLALTGAGVMLLTGWLGGELANRVGVGLGSDDAALGDILIEPLAPEMVEPLETERHAAHA